MNRFSTVRVRPETMGKLRRISKARRWTLVETFDAVADEFIESHEIPSDDAAPASVAGAQPNTTGVLDPDHQIIPQADTTPNGRGKRSKSVNAQLDVSA